MERSTTTAGIGTYFLVQKFLLVRLMMLQAVTEVKAHLQVVTHHILLTVVSIIAIVLNTGVLMFSCACCVSKLVMVTICLQT